MIQQKQQHTPTNTTIPQMFNKLMTQTSGFQDLKNQIRALTNLKEKLTYHALVDTQEQYLQVYGFSFHQQDQFSYINQLLHSRTTQVLDRIDQNKIILKSTIPAPPPPPPQISPELAQEVQSVLNNVDLPLSLFKRNDNYWSHDNPKTLQVKQYIKQLHDNDKKWKGDFKKKRQQILNQRNQQYHRTIEQNAKQQQKIREQEKIKMIKKIQFIKSQSEVRKKTIDEGLQFIKKQGRPLYKKMEQQFHNKVQIPTLEQKKKKLSELRELRRSVDLTQITQHKQKYQKIKEEHEAVKIINDPVKISYKSHFYKSLEKSSVREFGQQSRLKSLVDKRIQYAEMVKNNFKPAIDEQKSNQIAQRIEEMHKRFRRVKKTTKQKKQADQDEDQDAEEEVQEEPEPEPEPEEEQEDQNQDEDDDQPRVTKKKDDQYEPTNQQRYKMGLKFLQQARRRRKKIEAQKQEALQGQKNIRNKTFSAKDAIESKVISQQRNTIVPISLESNKRIQYRNYLHEMSKTNKTIDFIDTSQIKSELTQDLKLKAKTKVESLQNKIRYIEEKAKQEEQLLKHRKVRKNQAIGKKQQLDNAIIDTIKARLALMNN